MAAITADSPPAAVGSNLVARMAAPLVVAAVIGMLVVPLSPAAISLMFALNISSGLVILAAAAWLEERRAVMIY